MATNKVYNEKQLVYPGKAKDLLCIEFPYIIFCSRKTRNAGIAGFIIESLQNENPL